MYIFIVQVAKLTQCEIQHFTLSALTYHQSRWTIVRMSSYLSCRPFASTRKCPHPENAHRGKAIAVTRALLVWQVFAEWHNKKKEAARKVQEDILAERKRKGILSGREIFAQVTILLTCLVLKCVCDLHSIACLLVSAPLKTALIRLLLWIVVIKPSPRIL